MNSKHYRAYDYGQMKQPIMSMKMNKDCEEQGHLSKVGRERTDKRVCWLTLTNTVDSPPPKKNLLSLIISISQHLAQKLRICTPATSAVSLFV